MDIEKEIKLSSSWGNVGLYGGALLCIMMITPIYLAITNQRFHFGMIFGSLLFLLLISFVIYQFIYVCDARIIDDKLVLKKNFRPSKSYTFDKIDYVSSFQLKTTKYITVEMKKDDEDYEKYEKYIIVNTYSLLSFENKDAEETLVNLMNFAKKENYSS